LPDLIEVRLGQPDDYAILKSIVNSTPFITRSEIMRNLEIRNVTVETEATMNGCELGFRIWKNFILEIWDADKEIRIGLAISHTREDSDIQYRPDSRLKKLELMQFANGISPEEGGYTDWQPYSKDSLNHMIKKQLAALINDPHFNIIKHLTTTGCTYGSTNLTGRW